MELLIVVVAVAASLVLLPLSYFHGRHMQRRTPIGKKTRAIAENIVLAVIWVLVAMYFSEVTWLFSFSVLFTGACLAEAAGRVSSHQ